MEALPVVFQVLVTVCMYKYVLTHLRSLLRSRMNYRGRTGGIPSEPYRTVPFLSGPNHIKPNQTKPNQTKPNPIQPNQTKPGAHSTHSLCGSEFDRIRRQMPSSYQGFLQSLWQLLRGCVVAWLRLCQVAFFAASQCCFAACSSVVQHCRLGGVHLDWSDLASLPLSLSVELPGWERLAQSERSAFDLPYRISMLN